jgi:BirA family biotin operon repressor/biotin-[acetyl-CoA-carboxylase] ligase
MELPNPVSLAQLKKQEYDVLEELHLLIGICKRNFNQLRKNPEKLIKNYHQSLYQLNTWDYYKVKDEPIKGRIIGVDQFGRLGLEQENSEISYFDLKEVKFILN